MLFSRFAAKRLLRQSCGEVHFNINSSSTTWCLKRSPIEGLRNFHSSKTGYSSSHHHHAPSEDHQNKLSSRKLVGMINSSLEKFPLETGAAVVGMDILSVVGMYNVLSWADFVVSPEFAMAYAVNRALRRPRLPLDLTMAAILARMFPIMTEIKLVYLIPGFRGVAVQKSEDKSSSEGFSNKMKTVVYSGVDKYGAACLLGSKFSGLIVVTSLYCALRQGIDIAPFLASFGMEDVGKAAGTWAAAVVVSTPISPVSFCMAAYLGPVIGRARANVMSTWGAGGTRSENSNSNDAANRK